MDTLDAHSPESVFLRYATAVSCLLFLRMHRSPYTEKQSTTGRIMKLQSTHEAGISDKINPKRISSTVKAALEAKPISCGSFYTDCRAPHFGQFALPKTKLEVSFNLLF
jgi:hypothetical protein